MTTYAAELWEQALDELSKILGASTILNFFGGSKGTSYIDNTLTVTVPANADPYMLQHNWENFILTALQKSGAPEEVRLVLINEMPDVLPEVPNEDTHQETKHTAYGLIEKFTFDTFVEGPSNQFPLTMAKYVAAHPGDDSSHTNPLFMYGPTGVGKTHILHAIGNLAKSINSNLNVIYTTTENLLNEWIGMWKNDETKVAFRKKYRTLDILLVDDIQFISGKKGLQEEFFNIFNELTSNQKQIVMTSDRAPKDIPDLVDRLTSRFQSGICADIDIPAYETRLSILRLKLREHKNITLPDEIINFIAKRVSTSVRALEGALSSVINYARILPNCGAGIITTEVLEKSILKDILTDVDTVTKLTCSDIINAVCQKCDITKDQLLGPSKLREFVIPRQIAMFLCRKLTTNPLPELGRVFERNHSTVLHGCKLIQGLYKSNDTMTVRTLNEIMSALNRPTGELN